MVKRRIRYYLRGLIERASGFPLRYRWVNGYSAGENGHVEYPWMTYRECQAQARSECARAVFVGGTPINDKITRNLADEAGLQKVSAQVDSWLTYKKVGVSTPRR